MMLECVIEENNNRIFVTPLIKHCRVSWIYAGILYFCAERSSDRTPAMTANIRIGILYGLSQYFESSDSKVSQIRPCSFPSTLFTNHLSLDAVQHDILALSLDKKNTSNSIQTNRIQCSPSYRQAREPNQT